MKKKADFKFNILLQNKKKLFERDWEYAVEKNERKKQAYINKKEAEYKRRMLNEIRKVEWRPVKEKKEKVKLNLMDFAAKILQENSRLRDSDKDGNGHCISCNTYCSWSNHQWWHLEARWIKNLTLEPKNVNLQCKNCNWDMWPKWDTVRKEKVIHQYKVNLDKKYWEWTAKRLEEKKVAYFSSKDESNWDYDTLIPSLIEWNERLWKEKTFYKPSKNWRKIWEKYKGQ